MIHENDDSGVVPDPGGGQSGHDRRILTPDKQQLSAVDGALALTTEGRVRVAKYVRASRAPATRRAYESDWRRFAAWCERGGVSSLPAAPETLAQYLAEAASALRPSTLKRHLASISVAHRAAGLRNPAHSEGVRSTMAGIRRVHGVAPVKKVPIVVGELRTLLESLEDDPAGRRDRAVLLLGWCAALRRSELAALRVEHLDFVAEGLIICVASSKTDQDRAGREIAIGYASEPSACPVLSVRVWMEAAGITVGPVFRRVDRHGTIGAKGLTGRAIAAIVKRRASRLGLDPRRVGGHSLRSGFATSAAQAGVAESEIAAVTGHRSLAVLRGYVRRGRLFSTELVRRVGL